MTVVNHQEFRKKNAIKRTQTSLANSTRSFTIKCGWLHNVVCAIKNNLMNERNRKRAANAFFIKLLFINDIAFCGQTPGEREKFENRRSNNPQIIIIHAKNAVLASMPKDDALCKLFIANMTKRLRLADAL